MYGWDGPHNDDGTFTATEDGYMDDEAHTQCDNNEHRLLIVDVHSSHTHWEVIQAKTAQILAEKVLNAEERAAKARRKAQEKAEKAATRVTAQALKAAAKELKTVVASQKKSARRTLKQTTARVTVHIDIVNIC